MNSNYHDEVLAITSHIPHIIAYSIVGTVANLQTTIKKEVLKYLDTFKDHQYVFNLGHGILPETKIEMVEELVKIVRSFRA